MYTTGGEKLDLSFEESLNYAADNPEKILKRKSSRVRRRKFPINSGK